MAEYREQIANLAETIKTSAELKARGGGTKTALSEGANLDLGGLSGVLEYDPQEYTLTALAGTPMADIEGLLNKERQYMPFDPVMVSAGSSLGGAIASGLSGSGRYRYGGIRDFLLGIHFFTGSGTLHRGGAKVIKNASGFDLPKLMVGSLGRFGIMTEATLKVFPKPEVFTTLKVATGSLEKALEHVGKLAMSSFELSCLDFDPAGTLYLRFGGQQEASHKRLERIKAFLGLEADIVQGEVDESYWQGVREFNFVPEGFDLLKVPLTLSKIAGLESRLDKAFVRRYSVGGNLLWLALPQDADKLALASLLAQQGLSALALTGSWKSVYVGKALDDIFAKRLLAVL
ncbi:MAG: FAD-binding protein, partial [Trueperaceae bacterium]|nr:FAD-binding protein [Trueperaceae bacterium]